MGKRIEKVNPQRKRVRVAKEFKVEAVRLLERGEKPAAQVALELGVARNQLYKWQAQLQCGYTLRAVAAHLDTHYTAVSKVVNENSEN